MDQFEIAKEYIRWFIKMNHWISLSEIIEHYDKYGFILEPKNFKQNKPEDTLKRYEAYKKVFHPNK